MWQPPKRRMYNLATDAPPKTLEVKGGVYSINTDYRVWIEVFDVFMFRDNDPDALLGCIKMVFNNWQTALSEQDPKDIIAAMCEFLKGYPEDTEGCEEPNKSSSDDGDNMNQERYFDFKHDLNLIIIAIRNQSGIDLSYKCKHFHWWLFLLEFQSLESHHQFCQIRSIREYQGKDKAMLAQKRKFALPKKYTSEQREQFSEMESLFYNS